MNMNREELRRDDRGATMAEYGLLAAIILLGSIGSVVLFGQNVKSYYTGTVVALEDPTAVEDSSGIRFVNGAPIQSGPPQDDPFGHIAAGGTFLYGTKYADNLTLDGVYDGVYGLAGSDNIIGTNVSEIFVGGPGDDWIEGGKGADTYSYTLGDGIDYINEASGDTSTDTLNVPHIALSDISGAKNEEDLRLIMPDGGEIFIRNYFTNFEYDPQFEKAIFSDVTLNSTQEFRDMVAEKQKDSGLVVGTKMNENYSHTMATDGSYRLMDDHYLAKVDPGALTFTDIGPEDASFTNFSNNYDLRITLSDGDVITIDKQNSIKEDHGVWGIQFEGGDTPVSLDLTGIRTKSVNDQKASGSVIATRWTEKLSHDAADNVSYTLENDHYLGDPLETFEVVNALPDDVSFKMVGKYSQVDFEMTFEETGAVVRVLKGFNNPGSNNHDGIKDVLFIGDPNDSSDDVYMDPDAIVAKILEDQRPTGFIRGSQGSETFVYTPADVNMRYHTGYGDDSYKDTLDLSAYSEASTTFQKRYSEMIITLETGQTFTVTNQFSSRGGFEEVIFDGGATVLDLAAINAKAGV